MGFFRQGLHDGGLLCQLHRRDSRRDAGKRAAWVALAKPKEPARIVAAANPDFVGKRI